MPFSVSFPDKQKNDQYPYILLALLIGILLIVGSHYIPANGEIWSALKRLVEELVVVLISVWGVSLFYERFLAERHFNRFHENLRNLIRQGELNAAVCEALGILEIHISRRSYEDKHSFSSKVENVGSGDVVRITGRSLIFSMYGWRDLRRVLDNGSRLQMCLVDPSIRDSPLNYLAGYSPEEIDFAIHRFIRSVKPWLLTAKPKGAVEVRFHRVHILDSYSEISKPHYSRAAWDLNFGEGTEERRIFYLNGEGALGKNLRDGRYQLIWDRAEPQFRYENGTIELDKLSGISSLQPCEQKTDS